MKVLVITRNAWDDTNAIGNTLSNFLSGIEDIELAAIYFRSSMPQNELCENYYRTSEIEIMRKWFKPAQIGKHFFLKTEEQKMRREEAKREKKLVRLIQKYGLKLAYKLSDYLWYSEKWINKNLKDFIESFSPDLMIAFVKSAPQYYLTIRYLRENYKIPLFSWAADDEYTGLLKRNAQKEIQNLQYILNESAEVRGCSEKLCRYYNGIFGCKAEPLYKSCDLSVPVKANVNKPVTIVYAGNLLYGRAEILRQIADALEKISRNGTKVSFEIYSNTELLHGEAEEYFGTGGIAKYMGRKEYAAIKERLSTADIVLHVESFESVQILKTKYSFSTKIIDYLQSGSVLLAVGPREVASMEYIQHIPGVCVINNLNQLQRELMALLMDTANFHNRALEIRNYAREHHDARIVSEKLTETFQRITAGGV